MRIRGDSSGEAVVILLLSLLALSLLFFAYRNVILGPIVVIPNQSAPTTTAATSPTTTAPQGAANTVHQSSTTSTYSTTLTTTQATMSGGNATLYAYALSLINDDRKQYGLSNVTLSNETSGQQHAQSMLVQDYFSHWDTYGMKPYMRYTLLGGRGAVSENVAYRYSAMCGILGCTGNIEVKQALQEMEYDMMYNDSQCCNNGHRYNILEPDHNKVSVGIAYNSSTVYFAEDFEDDYVNWQDYGPNAATYEMYVSGSLPSTLSLSSILVSYDSPVKNMSQSALAQTASYGYGTEIAGVVSSPIYYYPGLTSVTADQYSVNGRQFSVSFNLKGLIGTNGAGEYTILVWMDDASGNSILGSTFTVFVGSDGKIYVPSRA